MATVLSYTLGIAIVLACTFAVTFAADKLFTDSGIVHSTPARIATDLIGSGVGFVIGVSLVTVVSI